MIPSEGGIKTETFIQSALPRFVRKQLSVPTLRVVRTTRGGEARDFVIKRMSKVSVTRS